MCGSVCICRDPALWLYCLILLCSGPFWASTFGQWCVASSQKQCTRCEGQDVPTSYQIISTWDDQKPMRFGPRRRVQLWMLRLQTATTNPTRYTFKSLTLLVTLLPYVTVYCQTLSIAYFVFNILVLSYFSSGDPTALYYNIDII